MNKISIFGATGFIGSKYCSLYSDDIFAELRDSKIPQNNKIIYFRSTNTNYNVFESLTKDINTNLTLLAETFQNFKPNTEFNLISSWFVHYPKGFYSATKLCQEHLTESFCKTFNHKYRILRLCNIIGGDSGKSSKKNALEFLINKLKNNEKISIYDGDNYRKYLHIEDCCEAIKLITTKGEFNTIYEVGDSNSYRIIDLIEYCKSKIQSKSDIEIIETPKFHQIVQQKDFWMEPKKLLDLGFKPKYNIYSSLDKILND